MNICLGIMEVIYFSSMIIACLVLGESAWLDMRRMDCGIQPSLGIFHHQYLPAYQLVISSVGDDEYVVYFPSLSSTAHVGVDAVFPLGSQYFKSGRG